MRSIIWLGASTLALSLPLSAVAAAPEFYGRINISLDRLSDYQDGGLPGALNGVGAGNSPLEDGWFVESNASRLGVRGRAPLDVTPLSVIYQLEVGYDVDGDSDTFSTRNSFLGLGTPFGDVFAGRYDSPVKLAEGRVDQFNNTAADISHYFYGQRRNDDTLNWESPQWGDLVLRAQIGPGEAEDVAGEEKDGLADTWGLSATWNPDKLYAAVAYESSYLELNNPALAPVAVAADLELLRGVLGITVGPLDLGALVERTRIDPDQPGQDRADSTSYLLSAGWRLPPRLTLKAQAGRVDGDDFGYENDIVVAGADYQLAKGTKVYGLVAASDATLDYPGGPRQDDSGNLFSVGMEHKF
ncbi:porin [Alloalcanivorax sp. C16-1]|uniref:porin n=1 Tax=Alloalcanivorax sp. C16-1 TaxID=3390051 RepID=UPI00397091F9